MPYMAHHANHPGSPPMRHGNQLAHWIFVGEISVCKNAVDDHHRRGVGGVGRSKESALKQRDLHHLKVLRSRLKIECVRRVLHRSGLLSADPEGADVACVHSVARHW